MTTEIYKLVLDALPGTSADLRNRTGLSKTTVSRQLLKLIHAKVVCEINKTKRPKVFVACLPDGTPVMKSAPAMLIEKVRFTAPARHYLFALYGG